MIRGCRATIRVLWPTKASCWAMLPAGTPVIVSTQPMRRARSVGWQLVGRTSNCPLDELCPQAKVALPMVPVSELLPYMSSRMLWGLFAERPQDFVNACG